jgi:hypothetical protein
MYDSVNIWLGREQAGIESLSAFAESRLTGLTEIVRPDSQVILSGHLQNYKVSISQSGISLKGSLAKYYLGDNIQTLTRADSQKAIEKMQDETSLPIDRAKVTRFDIAANLLMRLEPKAYYPYLGDSQYYKRSLLPDSVYYSNSQRVKLFYNKAAEAKKQGQRLPEVTTGYNILRYELRFTGRITKQFSRPEITVSTLVNEQFYIEAVSRWLQEYRSIHKQKEISINFSGMKSPKDFFKQLELFAVHTLGQDRLMQAIDEMRSQGTFEKPEYYSRLKRDLRELCNSPKLTTSSDLVNELDKKVDQACKHYR